MHKEINLDSIRALEKQIEEHERAIIRLKRTRNSLLNVSTLLPPEVLGNIFSWNVVRDGDFGGLPKDSHNFLLVCHRWFEVASRTPELWSFWGNTIQDWAHWHARCGTAPLDLILYNKFTSDELDDKLRDALRDRAARDTIRRVHLNSDNKELTNSIISSIIVKGEVPQSNRVESFVISSRRQSAVVDVSGFFARYHLPKLKCLQLHGCRLSPRSLLKSQITTLTTLNLECSELSPRPSLSQLLSILSSNPFLQYLELSSLSITHASSGRSSIRVPLHHLRNFHLSSDFCHAFSLLDQLELPGDMDNLNLLLSGCSPSDLSKTLGPYLGDRARRRGRFPGGGLDLSAECYQSTFHLSMRDACERNESTEVVWPVSVVAAMSVELELEEFADELGFDLIAHIPQEQVTYLFTNFPILRSELCAGMCNLIHLCPINADLFTWFAEPEIRGPHRYRELLPSLDHLEIIYPYSADDDWSPLTNFLSRRAAVGNRISLLSVSNRPYMDEDAVESIKCAVKVFEDKDIWKTITSGRD